jgi:hypothetical protein
MPGRASQVGPARCFTVDSWSLYSVSKAHCVTSAKTQDLFHTTQPTSRRDRGLLHRHTGSQIRYGGLQTLQGPYPWVIADDR